ncbi:MAG: hypothetical protein ABIO43_05975, partial [Sphingomicrobium sp.]
MIRFLGSRGASAVTGLIMLALASTEAAAAPTATTAALSTLPTIEATSAYAKAVAVDTTAAAKSVAATVTTTVTGAVATVTGAVLQTSPSVTLKLAPQIAMEAAWLHKNGWPLYALVDRYLTGAPLDEQANCMAVAVYHEARGETVEGQLAVARV